MHIFLLLLLVALASSNTVVRDLNDAIVFDTFTSANAPSMDMSTSTEEPTTLLDKNGEPCQCVPYYMCAKDYDKAFDSLRELGYRGPQNPCSDYFETCCEKDYILQTQKPQPDKTKVKECGYRNIQGFGRTFPGQNLASETKFGEFPWVVALLDSKNSSYAGAGVIISPDVVITVAHIAKKFISGTLKIRAGEWDTQTLNEIYEHQEREVKEIYIHEEYLEKSLKNDIALLRLEQPLQLTEHINAICLPDHEEVFDSYKKCITNGWGKDIFGREGKYAVPLRKIEQDIVPHKECEDLLKKTRLGSRFSLHENFVCASENGIDNCIGDGGAALACPTDNNRYKLSGLVAWGIGCGQKDVPAVYVNVPKLRSWVDEKMRAWGLQTVNQ